jgi:hypothetical protein
LRIPVFFPGFLKGFPFSRNVLGFPFSFSLFLKGFVFSRKEIEIPAGFPVFLKCMQVMFKSSTRSYINILISVNYAAQDRQQKSPKAAPPAGG